MAGKYFSSVSFRVRGVCVSVFEYIFYARRIFGLIVRYFQVNFRLFLNGRETKHVTTSPYPPTFSCKHAA